ncbi:hypothetical protein GYH30_006988 [Glycine max]|nr:hypothetical protein GYH30_006988 [Glycine max]
MRFGDSGVPMEELAVECIGDGEDEERAGSEGEEAMEELGGEREHVGEVCEDPREEKEGEAKFKNVKG